MDTVLLPLTRSPRLAMYVDELQALLHQEAAKREEFRDWLDEDKKAEFINGEIVVHSPAKFEHTDAQKLLLTLLNTYVSLKKLGIVLHEKALIQLTRNDYEPDICFWTTEKASNFDRKQMVFPSPDLVVEILSPSTEQNDRGVKFDDYSAHGVQEYWLIDPDGRVVEQYRLEQSAYVLDEKLSLNDTLTSKVVKGFAIPVVAVFDAQANLAALRTILGQK